MGSPVAGRTEKKQLDFYDALREIMAGKTVTKREWGDRNYYGILEDGRLRIHKPDGKTYDWILSDGDIYGDDFVVI